MTHAVSLGFCALVGLSVLGGCSSDDPDGERDGSGGGGGGPDVPFTLEFSSPLCHDGLCWVGPAPQGNPLRDAHTSPEGTTFAVGDHGVLLRSSDAGFEAFGLPGDDLDGLASYGALRSVYALADDDVWLAGDLGVVLHLSPEGLVTQTPDPPADSYIDVHANASDDVWLAARRGAVFHFDGATWTRSLTATVGASTVDLVGMWVAGPSEVWALGQLTAGEPHLYRYDGTAWADEVVTLETSADMTTPGASVAITGSTPGQPVLAFEHRVVTRIPDGSYQTLYSDIPGVSFPRAVRAAHADASGNTWVAFDSGAVSTFDANGEEITATTGAGFGEGPEGRTLVLRAAGGIADPERPAETRLSVEPIFVSDSPERCCAPAGDGAVCLTSATDHSELWRFAPDGSRSLVASLPGGTGGAVRANAAGLVTVHDGNTLHLFDGTGERTVNVTNGPIEDVAVLDDGRVYFSGPLCTYYELAPGSSTQTSVVLSGGPAAADEFLCGLTRSSPTAVYLYGLEARNQDQDFAVIVRSADGALLHDAIAPRMWDYPIPAITAAGVPFVAGRLRGTPVDDQAAFRLDGASWTRLEIDVDPDVRLTAYGELAVVQNPSEAAPERGSVAHLVDATTIRSVRLPAHGLARLVPTDQGLFGVIQDSEGLPTAGFVTQTGVGLFFATPQAP